jgi:hypothetical protein
LTDMKKVRFPPANDPRELGKCWHAPQIGPYCSLRN